jgi:hypothetical protein
MKPYTTDTHGRNHYCQAPKEHKIPKFSKDRRGTRASVRQASKHKIQQELK